MNFIRISRFLGYMSAFMGITHLLTGLILENDVIYNIVPFSTMCFFISVLLVVIGEHSDSLSPKETITATILSWVICILAGSLPFMLHSELNMNFADALFESASAVTTTGFSVIKDLDTKPRNILLWRSLLNFFGGIGIIISAQILFKVNFNLADKAQKSIGDYNNDDAILEIKGRNLPNAQIIIYCCLLSCNFAFNILGGMNIFDALCYAASTISTGGLATHDSSMAYFDSFFLECVACFFMLAGAMPIFFYIQITTRNINSIRKNEEIVFFIIIVIFVSGLMMMWITEEKVAVTNLMQKDMVSYLDRFRMAIFTAVSSVTTTGFSNADYSSWGSAAHIIILCSTIIGGCSSSTAGGIKVSRFVIMAKSARKQIMKTINPKGVVSIDLSCRSISEVEITAAQSYFFLFIFVLTVLSFLIAYDSQDIVTAFSAACGALSNSGVGIGEIVGPAGNMDGLSHYCKYSLVFAMLLGRVEIIMFLSLFSKRV